MRRIQGHCFWWMKYEVVSKRDILLRTNTSYIYVYVEGVYCLTAFAPVVCVIQYLNTSCQ